jgi:N-methylhydantoinase A
MGRFMKAGVDTGGTFTDFVWLSHDGRLQIHKQLSTPADPAEAILAGLAALAVPATAAIVHGSTVATNALLERRGARTALITTTGFADVLAIGRQNRPDLYALVPQKAEPLVPRRWRFEVAERVTAQGEILVPLDEATLEPIWRRLRDDRIESVAVCLLFSFLRPEHEQRIKELLGKRQVPIEGAPLSLSLSSEILPEYREYERTAATVINAYVAPLMSRYLEKLVAGVAPRPLTVMQSNGGVISAVTAGAQAARTVLSGPAGGVVGAHFVARQAGFDDIITFDMGGTSTDVALCPGRLPLTAEGEIAGLPLRLPIIDIHTVGAGGGSLAYVDAGGALHVGPQSAGAEPGPACYGRDMGDKPLPVTTTDANLVLGRLDADHFLGGTMPLDEVRATAALSSLAAAMVVPSPETAAWGLLQVANVTMERAMRRISVERGYDPRRFTLVAFGGAGPLHACDLAQSLQIPRVLVPAIAGVLSALGMVVAAPAKDYSRTVMERVARGEFASMRVCEYASGEWQPGVAGRGRLGEWLKEQFEPLVARALAEMATEGHDPAAVELRYRADMRYVGQSHELTIGVAAPDSSTPQSLGDAFHEAHERRYGYRQPQAAVEIVTLRLTAVAPVMLPQLEKRPLAQPDAQAAIVGRKNVWFGERPLTTTLYDRERLRPGHRFSGPAVVFQYDTTTVIPPAWKAAVDGYGNLVLDNQ